MTTKPADEAMREAVYAMMNACSGPVQSGSFDMHFKRQLAAALRALDAAGYELRAKLSEGAARKLVQALWGAAFHQGTLEHRESVSDATLKKNSLAVQSAQDALMAALAAAPRLPGAGDDA